MATLIKSYLTKREQYVNFYGYESTHEKIDVGLVLGPLLFLIHINEIQNNTSLKVLNFTDYTLLYSRFKKYILKRQ